MALLAAVTPGIAGELALMFICVAVRTARELEPEPRILACWNVTRCARHLCMRKDQRKPCLCVVGDGKYRWAPALHRVAALAASAVGALRKLPAMRIRLVAVSACCMRNGRLEISPLVARNAEHILMFAEQRESGLRVIELLGKLRFLESECRMARIATLLECAFVRVEMAIGAILKAQSLVTRLSIRSGRVAAFA